MKRIGNLLREQRGFTLIEVLGTLVISSIVLTVFYNVFIMGITAYQKTGVEIQLRDEADYVLSDLMDVLQQSKIDEMRECSSPSVPCIEFTQNKKITEKSGVFLEENEDVSVTTTFLLNHSVKKTVKGNENQEEQLISDPYEVIPGDSKVEVICYEEAAGNPDVCKAGIVDITIAIQDTDYGSDRTIHVKPMILNSQFGF
ncbi:prepilin-type N-terminal cleavage/methylation domain-containing protein [Metabacillus mangrovi]|uniref:prepilin-type N-terminal cleavage/methylation domain-containing protein n=1 Tax=Metabacillus mangrovi TaxID=1491830 RepID=UPI0012BA8B50